MFSKFTQEASSKWKLQFGHSFPWHNFRAKSFPHMALPADLIKTQLHEAVVSKTPGWFCLCWEGTILFDTIQGTEVSCFWLS